MGDSNGKSRNGFNHRRRVPRPLPAESAEGALGKRVGLAAEFPDDGGTGRNRVAWSLRFIQWFSAATALSIAVFVLSSAQHERDAVIVQLRERNRLKMKAAKYDIENYVGTIRLHLRLMSLYPQIMESSAESDAYLHAMYSAGYRQQLYHSREIHVIKRNAAEGADPFRVFQGGAVALAQPATPPAEERAMQREHIQRFAEDDRLDFLVSEPVPLGVGEPGRVFSVPIRSDGELLGIVAGMVPSRMISEALENSSLGNIVLLASGRGSFVGCTDFPPEMLAWFQERFEREGVESFFAGRDNAFYADRYAALWTRADIPGDHGWNIAFLYDEAASLDAIGITSELAGRGTAALVLLLGGAVIILCRAMRALEQSEERARKQFLEVKHIYNTSPVGLGFLDRELRFVRINEHLAAAGGHAGKDYIGKAFRDVFQDIAARVDTMMANVLTTGEAIFNVEVRRVTPSRYERVWLMSFHPIKSDERFILGMGVVVQDITTRVRAEEQARQRLADLAHLTRLGTMGEMATNLAHELNQPLAAIVNYVAMCAQRIRSGLGTPEELLDDIAQAAAQARRAGEIIEHLHRVVRKREPRSARVDINKIVRAAADLMESETRPNGVELHFELEACLPPVTVESIQIEQVIVNLMRNGLEALKETDPHDRRLEMRTTRGASGAVEFAIHDTGSGLTDESLELVFNPYFTTKPEGMGMGLSISRSIIEGHGGRLWATPSADRGTTFQFTLPGDNGGVKHAT